MKLVFDFNNPTRILFGCGMLNRLGEQTLPGKKACVIISSGKSTRKNGYLDRTLEQLEIAGVRHVIYDRFTENPLKETCEDGGRFVRENQCDFIVALGGGAVLDGAKMVSAMATNDGDLWDYAKGKTFKYAGLPVVTIPTTSGTGSEIKCSGVISNLATKEKIGFGDPRNIPVLSIVDPELMKSVPPKYTAYQGFDALFHHTEAMISNGGNIMSETIALSAIEHIARYLPQAVKDGNDIDARTHVAFASTIAGFSMNLTPLTAKHAIEHSMSAYYHNLQHGAGLIMIAKEFYRFFICRHTCDDRFIKMARAMGIQHADKADDFITALENLQTACGVDDLKMSEYGIEKSMAMTLAKSARAMQPILYTTNPCELTDEDVAGIIERSYR